MDTQQSSICNSIIELSQGNPGAITVLCQLDYEYYSILKNLNIVGYKIWSLYKDICVENISRTLEILTELKNNGDYEISIGGKNSVMDYLNSLG